MTRGVSVLPGDIDGPGHLDKDKIGKTRYLTLTHIRHACMS